MDMDFLSDPIFSDIGRSDFIGGIDNEALDFGQLPFMQVEASVGNLDDALGNGGHQNHQHQHHHHYHTNNNNNNSSNDTTLLCNAKSEPNDTNLPIATVSARVSLATTPIATPLQSVTTLGSHVIPQLPESPPDSGSEPPYSPLQEVHGLTLTTRSNELHNHNGAAMQQHLAGGLLQEVPLHLQAQFTPPHQQTHLFAPSMAIKQEQQQILRNQQGLLQQQQQQQQMHNNNLVLQHENGLLLADEQQQQQQQQQQLLYQQNSLSYECLANDLYGNHNYQHVNTSTANFVEHANTTALPNTVTASLPRVQVVGTSTAMCSRQSAPSTPINSSTRKRKMSTHFDCSDYANIKPDPGLNMSPKHQNTTLMEATKLNPNSPVSLHNSEIGSTPAHSNAPLSPALSTINFSSGEISPDGSNGASAQNGGENSDSNSLAPCIRFSNFQPQNWHKLCDQSLQELSVVYYRVDADKGFNFSISDDAFVCQKKNHFQITCHARLQGDATFIKTSAGLEKIKSFHLHFYGVKLEAPNQTIRVEQSQSDRSKKPFYPVHIDLQSHIVSKVTVGRLHFSETTNNNMRKKGRPNPEQRYFQLVVALHVHTTSGNFPVISQCSERIIVRASNPGQFESDVDLCWQRGLTQDSICHTGRVGINTDRPDESLVVHGNLKVSGHIVQPSDSRAKKEIAELDTSVQLRNLQKIRIVRYRYEPQFAMHSGLQKAVDEKIEDIGVIAQEVREVIPDAVQEAGSIVLPNGNVIENFLLVNKDRIFMENVGAVKELCKVTGSLQNRIEDLERANNHLSQAKSFELNHFHRCLSKGRVVCRRDGYELCSNRCLQAIILLLVLVMAACLAAVSTLYFMEHDRKQQQNYAYKQMESSQLMNDYMRGLMHYPEYNSTQAQNYWQQHFSFPIVTSRPQYRNFSKPAQEYGYNDNYTPHGRFDDTAVVVEKPIVQPLREPYKVTTSAPLSRINKTISSKHKPSKWSLPLAVLKATQVHHGHVASRNGTVTIATATLIENHARLNKSSTTSEKTADIMPLTQDFENNSIDSESQQMAKSVQMKKAAAAANKQFNDNFNDAPQETALAEENVPADLALKLPDVENVDSFVSTASSNGMHASITTDATAQETKIAEPIIYSVYKSISQASTVKSVQLFSNETPHTGNKSQGSLDSILENTDATDLQNLSSNNDSAENPITINLDFVIGQDAILDNKTPTTKQSHVSWLQNTHTQLDMFGAPIECTQQTLSEDISNCQSFCFEDSNQLPSIQRRSYAEPPSDIMNYNKHESSTQAQQPSHQANVVNINAKNEIINKTNISEAVIHDIAKNVTKISAGKISYATEAVQKQQQQQFSAEQPNSDDNEHLDTLLEHSASAEQFDVLHKVPVNINENAPSLSVEVHVPPLSDCWQISSSIVAERLNNTIQMQHFCPNNGKSLNQTYILPLSKYFKEPAIELHLASSVLLQWSICNQEELTKRDGKHVISTTVQQHNSNAMQTRHNTTVLYLNIPSRGYFVKDLTLRANSDLKKQNICQETLRELQPLLQYNFRIVRDCD